jgi:hypothetical protein
MARPKFVPTVEQRRMVRRIASGQHQDRDLVSGRADPPGQLDSVESRHHHIENGGVER